MPKVDGLWKGHDQRLTLPGSGAHSKFRWNHLREMDMAKRTTHRSSKGTKLYAVRDKKGQFKDIQTYKRAHGQDIKRKSKKEKA
jgi:hypothetical protein